MKTGILGGTFDPIHIAHEYMAEETKLRLGLDRIYVMPNSDPPHKDNEVTSFNHRINMVKLAMENYSDIKVTDFENTLEKPSYTYLTLNKFKETHMADQLFFIIGGDSLISFHKWVKPEEILKYASLVCFERPGYKVDEIKKSVDYIKNMGGEIILLDSLDLEISSTFLRSRFKEGIPLKSLINPKVYNYIVENGLYSE